MVLVVFLHEDDFKFMDSSKSINPLYYRSSKNNNNNNNAKDHNPQCKTSIKDKFTTTPAAAAMMQFNRRSKKDFGQTEGRWEFEREFAEFESSRNIGGNYSSGTSHSSRSSHVFGTSKHDAD